jgi:hypothetical protein
MLSVSLQRFQSAASESFMRVLRIKTQFSASKFPHERGMTQNLAG